MTSLIAAAAFFVLLHLLVAGTRLRGVLVGAIKEGPYMGLFSLASLAGIVWLSMAYGAARGSGEIYWDLGQGAKHAALGLVLIALLLAVPGLFTANPTSVKQEGALDKPDPARGILRVTRHPFLWGVAVWATAHLLANGDTPSLILFGSLLVLAVFGTVSIDMKRGKALGEKYRAFLARTSNVPFAAILTGKQTLKLGEIGWWKLLIAVALYAALLWAHPMLFGVDPRA